LTSFRSLILKCLMTVRSSELLAMEFARSSNPQAHARVTIRIVVRLNKAIGGIKVSESALIRAIKRSGVLFDDEPLLLWLGGQV